MRLTSSAENLKTSKCSTPIYHRGQDEVSCVGRRQKLSPAPLLDISKTAKVFNSKFFKRNRIYHNLYSHMHCTVCLSVCLSVWCLCLSIYQDWPVGNWTACRSDNMISIIRDKERCGSWSRLWGILFFSLPRLPPGVYFPLNSYILNATAETHHTSTLKTHPMTYMCTYNIYPVLTSRMLPPPQLPATEKN